MTEITTPVRCAVYTRKSTDEGLDMEFNSLDAQREAGEAFIVSQKLETGNVCQTVMMTAASAAEIWSAPR